MEFKTLIAWIFALILILFGLSILYNFASPMVKNLLGMATINNTDVSTGINPFKQFVKEYKECKTLPDDECLCPFSTFALPGNAFIELENSNSLTSFNYYSGKIEKPSKLIGGCKPKENPKPGEIQKGCIEGSDYVVSGDAINIPYYLLLGSQFTKEGKFDISGYVQDSKIYLVYQEKAHSPPIKVLTTYDIQGSNEFTLEGLYKKGNFLYFVKAYSPSGVLDAIGPSGRLTATEDFYKKIRLCTKPMGYDNAVKIFNDLKDKVIKCSGENVFSATNCATVDLSFLEKNYKINIDSMGISLIYKNNVIDVYKTTNISFYQKAGTSETILSFAGKTLIIDPSDPQSSFIQIDVRSCPKNTACLTPVNELSKSKQAPSSEKQQIAKALTEQLKAQP